MSGKDPLALGLWTLAQWCDIAYVAAEYLRSCLRWRYVNCVVPKFVARRLLAGGLVQDLVVPCHYQTAQYVWISIPLGIVWHGGVQLRHRM